MLQSKISEWLGLSKQLASYNLKMLAKDKLVTSYGNGRFKFLKITQPGKNFIDQYSKNYNYVFLRAENIRFAADILRMPQIPVDWKKIQMKNWTQYTSEIDNIRVKINAGKKPTLELIPTPVDGENIYNLFFMLAYECLNVIHSLQERIGIKIGTLWLLNGAEWVVFHPLARTICKNHGQIRIPGVGKINASKPRRIGEFEWNDPRAAVEFMLMPQQLARIETTLAKMGEKLTPPSQGDNRLVIRVLKLKNTQNNHDGSACKIAKKALTPHPEPKQKPVSTTDKQMMAYVTIRNIESETSYLEKDWSIFVLKELADNAFDWLNDNYPAKSLRDKAVRRIEVKIWFTTREDVNRKFVHIAVRNTNVHDTPIFEDLFRTFDFHARHSTKRHQHRMTTGSLGDALKRCLGMGYALWTSNYNPEETFEDVQWNEPIIIRCNKKERRVFIYVDTARQDVWANIVQQEKPSKDIGTDTEVEVTLPLTESADDSDNYIGRLIRYYKIYKVGKSRTNFTLDVINSEY